MRFVLTLALMLLLVACNQSTLSDDAAAGESQRSGARELKMIDLASMQHKTREQLAEEFPELAGTADMRVKIDNWHGWKAIGFKFWVEGGDVVRMVEFYPKERISEQEAKALITERLGVPLPADKENRLEKQGQVIVIEYLRLSPVVSIVNIHGSVQNGRFTVSRFEVGFEVDKSRVDLPSVFGRPPVRRRTP